MILFSYLSDGLSFPDITDVVGARSRRGRPNTAEIWVPAMFDLCLWCGPELELRCFPGVAGNLGTDPFCFFGPLCVILYSDFNFSLTNVCSACVKSGSLAIDGHADGLIFIFCGK